MKKALSVALLFAKSVSALFATVSALSVVDSIRPRLAGIPRRVGRPISRQPWIVRVVSAILVPALDDCGPILNQ